MMSGFVGSTVMAWTLVASGSPLVSCSQPPSPTRRKIPGRLPDVNDPTPTYTRDGLDALAMAVSFRRTIRRYDSTPGQPQCEPQHVVGLGPHRARRAYEWARYREA